MERAEYEVMAAVEARHWWYGGMRAIAATLLDPLYRYRRNLRILDAGCGTGGNAVFLQRYGSVVGIDIAPEAISYGAEHLPAELARASVLDLPFADRSFDLVTSFDVLYHRAVPNELVALREVRRVLAPLGRLLIRLPAYEFLRSKHDRAVHTRRRYTRGDVRGLLSEAGFYVERCSYVNALLFPLPLAQRLVERAAPTAERTTSDLTLPPAPLNTALRWPMALESAWLAGGGSFPFGLSIMALAHANTYEHVTPRPRTGTSARASVNGRSRLVSTRSE
ncbi:MAG: class I SAM-dependent methyltransferase [Chloroflexales bacterium]|nr:class I SAM-dependent methyltransferase [Chloroflexales bacterium]